MSDTARAKQMSKAVAVSTDQAVEPRVAPYAAKAVVATGPLEARKRKVAKRGRRASLRSAAAMFVLCILSVVAMTAFVGVAGLVITGGWHVLHVTGVGVALAKVKHGVAVWFSNR